VKSAMTEVLRRNSDEPRKQCSGERYESTEVDVRGGRLPVWTQAGEPATLVFLHIWGGSHRTFAPVIARVTSGCAVVSYDHRGWGAARDLPGPYGISELADDALAVIAGLGISRYVLVGHSMGGKVAQLAASRRPDGLAALALIAPAPPRPAVDAKAAQALTHAFDSRATVGDALQNMLTERPLRGPRKFSGLHAGFAIRLLRCRASRSCGTRLSASGRVPGRRDLEVNTRRYLQ
jgi:pimeloyl-ACP methyl ester carboxylesterase